MVCIISLSDQMKTRGFIRISCIISLTSAAVCTYAKELTTTSYQPAYSFWECIDQCQGNAASRSEVAEGEGEVAG